MFQEGFPIFYDAAADLKKWPSLNSQRLNGKTVPIWFSTARWPNASGN
jgi:hypothetical protein